MEKKLSLRPDWKKVDFLPDTLDIKSRFSTQNEWNAVTKKVDFLPAMLEIKSRISTQNEWNAVPKKGDFLLFFRSSLVEI